MITDSEVQEGDCLCQIKKKNENEYLSPTEKRRMLYEIQTLGKKLLALNGGRDIPITCVDGRGKEFINAGK